MHFENFEYNINNKLRQITFELTGKCNLRCGYCIYNDTYIKNRSFNQQDMTIEIAKASVDYAVEHSGDQIAITFYGGEPLLNFNVMKWTIDYSLEKFKNKKFTFSLTTNMTLVTEEIALYLASIPNLNIVCSLDGPESVHNEYRKYANGSGSFNDAIRGMKLLSKAFEKSNTNRLSINAVLCPPYTYEKINDINNFFSKLEYLKPCTNIKIGYAAKNSIKDSDNKNRHLLNNFKYRHNSDGLINPLWIWQKRLAELSSDIQSENNNIYSSVIQDVLLHINNRLILENPLNLFPFNGCCVPGARRLYISTDGNLSVCEKIGTSPSIGNILSGINIENIKKYYVNDYAEKSFLDCSKCWAIRLCKVCYAGIYNEYGIDVNDKRNRCKSMRDTLISYLSLYYSIYETNVKKLDFLKDMKFV